MKKKHKKSFVKARRRKSLAARALNEAKIAEAKRLNIAVPKGRIIQAVDESIDKRTKS